MQDNEFTSDSVNQGALRLVIDCEPCSANSRLAVPALYGSDVKGYMIVSSLPAPPLSLQHTHIHTRTHQYISKDVHSLNTCVVNLLLLTWYMDPAMHF